MSCMGKLFLSILDNRLLHHAINNNILHKTQLGFVPGNRTSDAHIIINNIIQKYCHKGNSKIFSCFVDFSKAFDTVPRDILLKKLLSYNIKGKFFKIIRNIYTNDKACVKIQNQVTDSFGINQGVRQGCVLSPLLFNIFLSDLAKNIDTLENKVKLNKTEIAVRWSAGSFCRSWSRYSLIIELDSARNLFHRCRINGSWKRRRRSLILFSRKTVQNRG